MPSKSKLACKGKAVLVSYDDLGVVPQFWLGSIAQVHLLLLGQ